MRRWRWRLIPIAIAALAVGWQWLAAPRLVDPETGASHRVGLTVAQETALGVQAYRQVLAESDVVAHGAEVDRVRRVAARLAANTGEGGRDFAWEVSVVRSDQANAFCLPGGKIVVYTGILGIARDDAELATVMGHEMAHATCHHAARRALQHNLLQTAMVGAQASLGGMDYQQQRAIMGVLGAGAQYGVALPFSREDESEADARGLTYLARSGYDPHAAIAFWERMQEASGGNQPPEFASTHPSHGTRIARLRELMPEAERIAAAARAGAPAKAD